MTINRLSDTERGLRVVVGRGELWETGLACHQPRGPGEPERLSLLDGTPRQAPGTVVSVLQKGYVLNDRLLRPALVAVAKD